MDEPADDNDNGGSQPRVTAPEANNDSPDHGDLVREVRATRTMGNYDPDPEDEVRIIVSGTDEGRAKQAFAGKIEYELQKFYGYYPTRWDPISSWSVNVEPDDFESGAYTYLLQHDSFERLDNCSYRVEVHVTFEKTGYTYDAATDCFY